MTLKITQGLKVIGNSLRHVSITACDCPLHSITAFLFLPRTDITGCLRDGELPRTTYP